MTLNAYRCTNGHVTYPDHWKCPTCGEDHVETIDLSDKTGTIITWTTNTATPPGVRQPNHLGIIEFAVAGDSVRVIGQLTTDNIDIGDTVTPEYTEELRDPSAGIRDEDSQAWDGYQFTPVNSDE
ncbi:MAG: Zn-ribbon domain-containing OB-fold protein [Halobacteriaceae archaeon]